MDEVPATSLPTLRARRRVRLAWLPFGWVRVPVALVLLVAAALKAHQLSTQPFPADVWWRVAETTAEWTLGLWLLAGLFPLVACVAGIVCFAVFAGVTTHKLLALPDAACGCFGAVRVAARHTLILDLVCLAALAVSRPRPPWRPQQTSLKAAGGLLLFALLAAAGMGLAGYWLGAAARAAATPQPPPLPPPPTATFDAGTTYRFDFGRIPKGEQHWAVFAIRNPTAKELRVRSVDANCDCLKTIGPTTLPAGGQDMLLVLFTPTQVGPYDGTVVVNLFGPVEPTYIRIKAEVRE